MARCSAPSGLVTTCPVGLMTSCPVGLMTSYPVGLMTSCPVGIDCLWNSRVNSNLGPLALCRFLAQIKQRELMESPLKSFSNKAARTHGESPEILSVPFIAW